MKVIHDGLITRFETTAYGRSVILRPNNAGNFELFVSGFTTVFTWEEAEQIGKEITKLAKKMKFLANEAAEEHAAVGEFIEDEGR